MQTENTASYLDVKQAASYLGVKVSWIRSAIYQKKIKHIKLGGIIRIDLKHLQEYVSACTIEANTSHPGKSKQ